MVACRHGYVVGAEALIFGVVIAVVMTLVAVNSWAVIDLRAGLAAAAREAVRASVEAPSDAGLHAHIDRVARTTLSAHGGDPRHLTLTIVAPAEPRRCAPVTVRASAPLAPAVIPEGFLGLHGWGRLAELQISATHSEVVDPYRRGLPGVAACGW